jgi:hypothetical protein
MKKNLSFYLVLSLLCLLMSSGALAGNKKLMTVNAAKVIAERAIVESVIGIKVRSQERVEDLVAQEVTVDSKTAAAIKGIEYSDIVYDPDKDIAQVEASIQLGRVTNIIGKNIDFGGKTIRRVGFATSTPAMAGPLRALRAAEMDAYKQLAKTIIGFKIDSNTSVKNYILESDTVRAKMMAAIYGAELVNYRWDQDGDAYVTMRLRFGEVEDVIGQKLLYDNEVIEVEGAGAQVDDFSQAPASNGSGAGGAFVGGRATIKEGSLDIPVSTFGGNTANGDVSAGGGADLLQ